jgi:LuxR family maltose regulon positive regulatory protein
MVVSDAMEFRSLPGTIAIARAYIAGAVQDAPGIVRHAQQALELLPEDDHFWRGAAASLMGIAHWAEGDLDAAHRYVTAGMADLQTAAGPASATAAAFLLADIRLAQGRLREAEHTIRQSLQRALHVGEPFPQGTPDLHVLLSEVHLERNDLMGAEECLQDARALGEYAGLFETRHRWYTVMARIRLAQGDLQAALELLTEAERLFNAGPNPESRPIAALRARVWLAQGRVAEAQAWAQENGLSMDDELDFRREFEHITLARLLFARYRSDPAGSALREVAGFLERLRRVAEAGGRVGSLIEILVLQALAHRDRGDTPLALACLERALALAEPEDYVRSFVDEGQPLAALLRALEALAAGGMPRRDAYRRRVLAAGEAQPAGAAPSSPERGDGAPRLIEPLSERELEVLRLLRTELSGPEIAHELTVSLNTLRTHTKNIYGKLGVNSRRAAVRRADELALS